LEFSLSHFLSPVPLFFIDISWIIGVHGIDIDATDIFGIFLLLFLLLGRFVTFIICLDNIPNIYIVFPVRPFDLSLKQNLASKIHIYNFLNLKRGIIVIQSSHLLIMLLRIPIGIEIEFSEGYSKVR